MEPDPAALAGEIYREESRRVLATLIRMLGGFDLAEEAGHEAFAAGMRFMVMVKATPTSEAGVLPDGSSSPT